MDTLRRLLQVWPGFDKNLTSYPVQIKPKLPRCSFCLCVTFGSEAAFATAGIEKAQWRQSNEGFRSSFEIDSARLLQHRVRVTECLRENWTPKVLLLLLLLLYKWKSLHYASKFEGRGQVACSDHTQREDELFAKSHVCYQSFVTAAGKKRHNNLKSVLTDSCNFNLKGWAWLERRIKEWLL